jgi:hypothetical protein
MRNNASGQSGVGLPVSKFGAKPQQNQPQFNNNNLNHTNNSGGNVMANIANDPNILRMISQNPQIKNILQQALNSGNSTQLQNVLTLIQTFAGNNGGNSGGPVNGNQRLGGNNRPQGDQVQHCSAPRYGGIMNAVKGINLSKLNDLKHTSDSKVGFVYYKKTEEANFTEYKLVFRFDKNKKTSYVYSHFVISRTLQSDPNFQNYLVTSNTTLISQIVNETDFSVNNQIKCIDLKIMFNGGIQNGISSSAFGGGGIPQQTFPGANQGFNQAPQQQFGGFNQQIPQQQFGGFNQAPQQQFGGFNQAPQQQFGGFNPMQQQFGRPNPQFQGQQQMGYNGMQNQAGGQGFGYQAPQSGGFGGQVSQNNNPGGTFLINNNTN